MKKLAVLIFVLLLGACSTTSNTNRDRDSDAVPGSREDFAAVAGDYVLFDMDSADLDSDAKSILDAQVEWLNQYPANKVLVEGHADERGTREYNIALGAKRANAAKQYLVKGGVKSSRIKTVSYGKEKPVVVGTGEESWRENRRAQSVLQD